jgi:exopolysaccharide biosynthesis WecB/TagA/CpsF family protein
MNKEKAYHSFLQLQTYCEAEDFKGYDPYDGLNSVLFSKLPYVSKKKWGRLVWIQLFKRSPVNLRKIVGVKKEYNPKALGLFLSAYCKLYQTDRQETYLQKIHFFTDKILESSSKGYAGMCWGYNFDWQARAFFQPKGMPTIVASSFVANALLDAYDITGEQRLLDAAKSTCEFILKDLNRSAGRDGSFAFSYSPVDHSVVFNASLLGARLLARVYHHTGEETLKLNAYAVVKFCCDMQNMNGSWPYGTYHFHQWIDNFHTGYNLECLADYMKYTGDLRFQENLEIGLNFYIHTFFTNEGIPKYYHNTTYPIDIHAPAQLVMTLEKLGKTNEYKQILDQVMSWTIDHLQDKKGYFYYQINKYFSSKIAYMRWSQAWMFLALVHYLYGADMDNIQMKKRPKRVDFLGIPIDVLTMKETIDAIDEAIANKERINHVVVNAGKIVSMQTDPVLHESVVSCDLINADGQAVVWASRFLGGLLPERVAGADLMQELVKLAADKQYKCFFLGAKEEIVKKVVDVYTEKYSTSIIAGYRNGYFKKEEEAEVAKQIAESGAQLLFVAITSPKKENFMYAHRELLSGVNFTMGVGGTFDVVAGLTKRAPVWMQNIGMEWFYRFLQEPRRMWKRYLIGNSKFIMLVMKAKFKGNKKI